MRITVLGANGMVGRLVVAEARRRGHEVTAFVHTHNPFENDSAVAVVRGDVIDRKAVVCALQGADAVTSALGAFRRGTGPVLGPGMRVVVPAMEECGPRRLVTLTGASAAAPGSVAGPRVWVNGRVLQLMDATATADGQDHVEVLAASTLAWTTVRAPTITASGPAGYRFTSRPPSLLRKVPGPAVAASLVDLAESQDHIAELVSLVAH